MLSQHSSRPPPSLQVSFPPIRGGYSEGFRQLVSNMLQKEPEDRPSANDLYTLHLVNLIGREEEDEEEVTEEPTDLTKTKSVGVVLWVWPCTLIG